MQTPYAWEENDRLKNIEQKEDSWTEQHTEFSGQTKLNQKSQISNF